MLEYVKNVTYFRSSPLPNPRNLWHHRNLECKKTMSSQVRRTHAFEPLPELYRGGGSAAAPLPPFTREERFCIAGTLPEALLAAALLQQVVAAMTALGMILAGTNSTSTGPQPPPASTSRYKSKALLSNAKKQPLFLNTCNFGSERKCKPLVDVKMEEGDPETESTHSSLLAQGRVSKTGSTAFYAPLETQCLHDESYIRAPHPLLNRVRKRSLRSIHLGRLGRERQQHLPFSSLGRKFWLKWISDGCSLIMIRCICSYHAYDRTSGSTMAFPFLSE